MAHFIPQTLVDSLASGPSSTKTTEVKRMQEYIQELLGATHHTFLQGSYKNDTAVSDINDVDIVAIRLRTYSSTHSGIPCERSIAWDAIFSEIETILRNQKRYNWQISRGDKCIRVRGAFNADVVPAAQVNRDHLLDPIVVYSFREDKERINCPRVHYEKGVAKNALTEGVYKPMVRMAKNWAFNHFGDDKTISSSFKVEALVHGVDDAHFNDDYAAAFILVSNEVLKTLQAQNAVIPSVCGYEDIAEKWDMDGRRTFESQLRASLQLALQAYQATSRTEAERYWRNAFLL